MFHYYSMAVRLLRLGLARLVAGEKNLVSVFNQGVHATAKKKNAKMRRVVIVS